MSKGEDLFDNIDANLDSDEGVDVNEFINPPEGDNNNSGNEPPANEPDGDEGGNPDGGTNDNVDNTGVDTSEFEKDLENTGNNNSVDDDSSADNSSSPLQLIASTLHAEGVIDLEEGTEITSSQQILDAARKKIKSNEFADLNDDQKQYVEALRAGIPEEVVKQNFNNINALNNITPEAIENNENLRRTLITQSLIAEGLSEAKATKSANRIVEAGEDVEEAQEAYNSLKTIESKRISDETAKLKQDAADKKVKDAEKLASIKTTVLEREEFIPGFKANSSTREKVYQTMTKVVGHDEQGNALNAINAARHENPEEMEMIESYLFNITNGFKDFTTLKGKLKTNSVKELDKKLQGTQSGGGTSKSVSKQAGGGLAAAIDNLKI